MTADTPEEARARFDENVRAITAMFQRYSVTMAQAAEALQKWGARMTAEAMRFALQRTLLTWTPEERADYERRVRELHAAEPDESLTDCMLRVGTAMEACR